MYAIGIREIAERNFRSTIAPYEVFLAFMNKSSHISISTCELRKD